MKLKLIIFSLLLLFTTNNYGQYRFKNKKEVAFFNIGLGGVIGGVGAMINKQPHQKLGNAFLKGFYKGAVGGLVVFGAKDILDNYPSTNNAMYLWSSKLLNYTGASIIENAAANRTMFENMHINIGFARFEFYTKRKHFFKVRILPIALYNTAVTASKYSFDMQQSLSSGNLIFYADESILYSNSEMSVGGTAIGNIVVYSNTSNHTKSYRMYVIMHELIHVYQYEILGGFNSYFIKFNKKVSSNKYVKWYNKYFYTDMNYFYFGLLNYGSNKIYGYHNNIFEREAYFMEFN